MKNIETIINQPIFFERFCEIHRAVLNKRSKNFEHKKTSDKIYMSEESARQADGKSGHRFPTVGLPTQVPGDRTIQSSGLLHLSNQRPQRTKKY